MIEDACWMHVGCGPWSLAGQVMCDRPRLALALGKGTVHVHTLLFLSSSPRYIVSLAVNLQMRQLPPTTSHRVSPPIGCPCLLPHTVPCVEARPVRDSHRTQDTGDVDG